MSTSNRPAPSLPQGEAEARAMAELQRRGIGVDASLVVADGKVHRFRTSADSSTDTAGWLVVHAGEWPCLLHGNWREDGEQAGMQKIPLWDNADKPLSSEERRSMDAAMKRRREAREAEKRREQDEAAERAGNDLAKASPADPDHPYLQRKRVDATPGLMQARIRHPKKPKDAPLEDALLVPLTNAQGHLRGYQRIYADGYKANMAGAEKLGTFHEIPGQGPNSDFLVVCEGYATAASISRAAQGATVISVCDKGNIWPVLKGLKEAGRLDPDRTLIVADNDWETARKGYLEAKAKGALGDRTVADFNPGLQAAKRAAEAFGCRWTLAVPDEAIYRTGEACTDANDLYVAKLRDCRQAGMAPAEAERLAVDTVRAMLDRGWGKEDTTTVQEPSTPPMQFIPFGEAVELTPPAELVKGFLPATGIGYLFGPSGTFKTFIAMQLGLHVSQGWPLAGNKVKRRPCYYLLLEGSTGLGKRTRALNNWRIATGRELAPDTAYMFWPRPFAITDPASVDALIATVNGAGHQGALIVVDTQSQAAPGIDEDKAKDMTLVLGEAKRISESTRGVVLLVGHTGKDEERGLRGSYAQRANVDFTLEVKRQPGARRVALKTGKEKDNSDDQAIAFDVQIWDVGTDEDGDPVSSCVAIPMEGVEYRPAPKATPAQARALDTLREAMRLKGADKVSRDEWGEVYLSKHPGTTAESKRVSFSKDRKALVEAGLVDCENDYYWPLSDYA